MNYKNEENTDLSVFTCGFSPIAIITVIIVGSIVILYGILTGLRKYKAGMPFVGSCSAAISAACHFMSSDSDAALLPIMWGVVDSISDDKIWSVLVFEKSQPLQPDNRL